LCGIVCSQGFGHRLISNILSDVNYNKNNI
jgi:hypothetical protein